MSWVRWLFVSSIMARAFLPRSKIESSIRSLRPKASGPGPDLGWTLCAGFFSVLTERFLSNRIRVERNFRCDFRPHPALAAARSGRAVLSLHSFGNKFVARHRRPLRMMYATMLDVPVIIRHADNCAKLSENGSEHRYLSG